MKIILLGLLILVSGCTTEFDACYDRCLDISDWEDTLLSERECWNMTIGYLCQNKPVNGLKISCFNECK